MSESSKPPAATSTSPVPASGLPPWGKLAIGIGCGGAALLFLALFFLGGLAAIFGKTVTKSGEGSTTSGNEELPPRVRATDLVKVYAENEVAADNLYKGKKLWVEGTVERVAKDLADDPMVILTGRDIRSVQCFFESEGALASLKVGSRIVIEGECDGLMINVLLRNCSVVTPERLKADTRNAAPVGGSGTEYNKPVVRPKSACTPVLASAMAKEFETDPKAARDKYQGKWWWVGGTVIRVGAGQMKGVFWLGTTSGMEVKCVFSDAALADGLKVEMRVVVEGMAEGVVSAKDLLLDHCEIVTPDRLPQEKK